jgi:hypothetical protein
VVTSNPIYAANDQNTRGGDARAILRLFVSFSVRYTAGE